MNNTKSIIGIHVRKNKYPTLEKALICAFKYHFLKKSTNSSIKCIQIHTHGPQHTRQKNINTIQLKKIIKEWSALLIVHSTLLTYPWKNTSYMLQHIFSQMEKSHILNAIGIVIHLPKLVPKDIIPILKIIISKNKVYKKKYHSKTICLLEMISQRPSNVSYETPEKINALITEIKINKITTKNIGICIDTAHIFVNKNVKIRKYEDAKKYLNKIKYPSFIKLIHLNGNSRSGYSDVHVIPFSQNDLIWKGIKFESSGLKAFIEFAKLKQIPVILELELCNSFKVKTLIEEINRV